MRSTPRAGKPGVGKARRRAQRRGGFVRKGVSRNSLVLSEELTPRLILQPHTLLSWNLRCWNPPKYCGSHRRERERHEVSLRDARRGRGQSRGSPLLPPRDPTGLSRMGSPGLHGPPIRRSVGPHLLLALLHRHRDRSQSETSINPSALRPSSLALPPPSSQKPKNQLFRSEKSSGIEVQPGQQRGQTLLKIRQSAARLLGRRQTKQRPWRASREASESSWERSNTSR